MKTNFLFTMSIAAALFSFSACSDKDDINNINDSELSSQNADKEIVLGKKEESPLLLKNMQRAIDTLAARSGLKSTIKSLHYSAIHRALQRYYYGNAFSLSRPEHEVKISYREGSSSQIGLTCNYFCTNLIYKIKSPIQIWQCLPGDNTYAPVSDILATTFHELTHASYYWRKGVIGYYWKKRMISTHPKRAYPFTFYLT